MKRFRLIVVAVLLLLGQTTGTGMAVDSAQAVSYRTHAGFTRMVFPAEMPLDYTLKIETSGDEKYLTLTSSSSVLFGGFTPVAIEDGIVRRLDMAETEGRKVIQIVLGPKYGSHRSFMVRQPDRLIVEVVGAAERKASTGLPIIVIDAGHGGPDPGTVVPSGGTEKDLCLDLAVRVRKLIEKEGARVVMTRNADYAVSDMERASIAHQHKGGLFLSIHVTSRPEGANLVRAYIQDWSVTEAWLEGSPARAELKPYLWGVQQLPHIYRSVTLAATISGAFSGKDGDSKMVVANLIPSPLLEALDMPAVVMEVADSSEKAVSLASEKHRQKIAEGIVRGIKAAVSKAVDSGGTN